MLTLESHYTMSFLSAKYFKNFLPSEKHSSSIVWLKYTLWNEDRNKYNFFSQRRFKSIEEAIYKQKYLKKVWVGVKFVL